MDRDELICRIIDSPEDEQRLRQEYIDWLEAQGDEESLAMARAERGFPEWLKRQSETVQQAHREDPESFFAVYSGGRLVIPEKWLLDEVDPSRIDEFLDRLDARVQSALPAPVENSIDRLAIAFLEMLFKVIDWLVFWRRSAPPPAPPVSPEEAYEEELAQFKGLIREGDKVYSYATPQSTWQSLSGRYGLVIFREGQPVETFDVMVS